MNSWIIENLGWTLLHSLWQIAFVALILFVALRVLREFSANSRYLASIFALIFSLILPITTFVYLSTDAKTEFKPTNQPLPKLNIESSFQSANPQNLPNKFPILPANSPNIAVTSSSPNIPFLPILVGFWLIGVLMFSIRLAGGVWTVHLYKTRKVSAVETHWQEKFDEMCASLQIRQKVKFLQSQMVEMPVVIGWLKPFVLVPASAFLQISPKELETILIHELTHIRRNDYLINFVQSLVEILFFFHPCVWWISAQIRTEREFAVDEIVSQIFETERFVYATALANLEESRATAPILAMAADGGNLMKRIEKILNGSRKISSKNVSIWSAIFAVTFVLGTVTGIYWLKTAETKPLTKNGGKIAVVFNAYRQKEGKVEYEYLLQLQTKYRIPATWVVDSYLIDTLKLNGSAKDFFRRAKENKSNFILNIPNMDFTTYIDGLDSYVPVWKEHIRFMNENLAEYGDKLTFYTTHSSQLPQPMEDYLKENKISSIKPWRTLTNGLMFDLNYEKNCFKIEKGRACQDTTDADKQNVRDQYLQYTQKLLDLRGNFIKEKLGGQIPQILSFTTNELTKNSAEELIGILQMKGYEFVHFDETVNEEAKKLQQSIWKDSGYNNQESELHKAYRTKDFNDFMESRKSKPTNFNVEVKNVKINEK